MFTYVYKCKKTGLEYEYSTPLDMTPQDQFAWRYGVHIYADRYHASATEAGLRKGDKVTSWADVGESFHDYVDALCIEARDRFNAGDVPGERESADPKKAALRATVAALLASGKSPDEIIAALSATDAPQKKKKESAVAA